MISKFLLVYDFDQSGKVFVQIVEKQIPSAIIDLKNLNPEIIFDRLQEDSNKPPYQNIQKKYYLSFFTLGQEAHIAHTKVSPSKILACTDALIKCIFSFIYNSLVTIMT